ncbi:hypothetical protein JP0001_14770 [Helicobacter pylori]
MAKKTSLFECQHCGFTSPKWLGKCVQCNAWESFIELNQTQKEVLIALKNPLPKAQKSVSIAEIEHEEVIKFSSTQSELDIVLGGGTPKAGVYLVGGGPGCLTPRDAPAGGAGGARGGGGARHQEDKTG